MGFLGDIAKKTRMLYDPIGGTIAAQNEAEQQAFGAMGQDEQIDQGTQDLVKAQTARAMRSPEEYQAEAMQGADVSTQMLGASQAEPSPIGYQDGGTGEAIKARAAKLHASDMNRLTQKAGTKATQNKFNATQMAMQQQEAMKNIGHIRTQRYKIGLENAQAARNQVLGNVLGMVGTIGGAVAGGMAGGPMGASAGANAGGASGKGAAGAISSGPSSMTEVPGRNAMMEERVD